MKLKVLLIEDDYLQRKSVKKALERELDAEVITKSDEYEFVRDFEQIAEDPPHVAVIDNMLRWASPAREIPDPPNEATAKHPENGGVRCGQRLMQDARTSHVRRIAYSVLGKEDLDSGTVLPDSTLLIVKEHDIHNLIDEVKKMKVMTS